MANTESDPGVFNTRMRAQWSAVAEGWRKRWPVFEVGAQPLSDRMVELAKLGPGMRVLDVATGIGEPALTAARRVGPTGAVVAVDQAPEMLAVARDRIRSAGAANVEFIEANAESLEFPPGSFDALVSRWGIMFFRDPVSTLGRLRACLVPGGRFVATIWGAPEQVPIISLPFAAFAGAPNQPQARPAGPNPFALAEPGALERVTREAGYADVRVEPWDVTFTFPSVDELIGHIGDVSAPVRAIMAGLPPERQEEMWTKMASAAERFAGPDGVIRMPNHCLIVSGAA